MNKYSKLIKTRDCQCPVSTNQRVCQGSFHSPSTAADVRVQLVLSDEAN